MKWFSWVVYYVGVSLVAGHSLEQEPRLAVGLIMIWVGAGIRDYRTTKRVSDYLGDRFSRLENEAAIRDRKIDELESDIIKITSRLP